MQKYTLGLDIGGTKIRIGLVDNNYRVFDSKKFLFNNKNKKTVLNNIFLAIDAYDRQLIKKIGIGITGLVDPSRGISRQSPNLPRDWHDVPLKKIIEARYKIPVTVNNDVHCLALGQALAGQGKKYGTVLALTLGTGIGAGLVINKKLFTGSINVSEFGHTTVAASSPLCSCGQRGHLEALCSGKTISYFYHNYTGKRFAPNEIEALAKHGNPKAIKTLKTMSHWLAIGIANAIHAYNPDVILIGGGLSKIRSMVGPAIKSAKSRLIYPALKATKIFPIKNLAEANVMGAAILTEYNK